MKFFVIALCLTSTPAVADVFMFETPSGNIQCTVGVEVNHADISCDIVQRSGPPAAPRPANCGAAWGHTFTMLQRGPVQMECAFPPRDFEISEKARYGVTGSWGGLSCRSETTGLTCRNADGHGFFLSRRAQQVF